MFEKSYLFKMIKKILIIPKENNRRKEMNLIKWFDTYGSKNSPSNIDIAKKTLQIILMIIADEKGILILLVPYARLDINVSIDSAITNNKASITV